MRDSTNTYCHLRRNSLRTTAAHLLISMLINKFFLFRNLYHLFYYRYLALKFKEMEEKMRKQKKGKVPKPEDDTREGDVDKLQIIEAETITKPLQTPPTEDIQEQQEEIASSGEK